MGKVGELLGAKAGGLLDKIVDGVNGAASKIDLSVIKTPTIKTQSKFGLDPMMMLLIAAAAALLLFGGKRK